MSDPTLAFAVDFDGTFTKAPETFRAIISSLKEKGHLVYIVTRRPTLEVGDWPSYSQAEQRRQVEFAIGDLAPIIFTYGFFKKAYVEEQGIHIDIWIDDDPKGVDGSKVVDLANKVLHMSTSLSMSTSLGPSSSTSLPVSNISSESIIQTPSGSYQSCRFCGLITSGSHHINCFTHEVQKAING